MAILIRGGLITLTSCHGRCRASSAYSHGRMKIASLATTGVRLRSTLPSSSPTRRYSERLVASLKTSCSYSMIVTLRAISSSVRRSSPVHHERLSTTAIDIITVCHTVWVIAVKMTRSATIARRGYMTLNKE